MSSKILSVILIFVTIIVSIATAQDLNYKHGELIVRFAPKVNGEQLTKTEKQALLTSLNAGTIKHTFRLVPGLSLLELAQGVTMDSAISSLKDSGDILYVELNYKVKIASSFPDDKRFDELWGMHNTGQAGGTVEADIDALGAWKTITDTNIIVAVIDSGIDYTHPDLADNMWVNETELNGTTGVDDDNNGYIDDIYGYDFCTYDDGKVDADPMDDLGHGTHCAGIIGAAGNNSKGVAGICWNVKLMALKFISYTDHGYTADAIDCIEYAVDNGAKVLSNSWGGGSYSQSLKDTIESANANGVIFVAAAGNDELNNDSYPVYPASYNCTNIISVMATNNNDEVASYSNYGLTSVDIAAPGGEIYYEDEQQGGILSTVDGRRYEFHQGTSMAAPHVAGACALAWAANPQLTHLEVKDYILQGVDKLDSLDGLCVTEGRLNLWRAVKGKAAFPSLTFTKSTDDVNFVFPLSCITYDICYDANGSADTNVVIVDFLPKECDYYSSSPAGNYNSASHSVTWNVGSIDGDDAGCFHVTARVNFYARPGSFFTNIAGIEGDTYLNGITCDVDVPVWGGEIIYVDKDANGYSNGTNWSDAYNDLHDALTGAINCGSAVTSIWVAAGTYKPIWDANVIDYQNYSFELVEGVGVFGHFAGYETSVEQRNLADANNETILDGRINGSARVYATVTADNINEAILDGLTIRGADTK